MHSPSAAAGARRVIRAGLAALMLALAAAAPAAAQTLFQGRIDVNVQDAQERAVPGAIVEIAGPATQQQTTMSTARPTSSISRRATTSSP